MSEGGYRVVCVAEVVREGSAGVTLIGDRALAAQPGQFVMVWLPGVGERPFTLMDDAPLSLSVAAIGPFTRALAAMQPGARLWVRGPYGRGFPTRAHKLLLLGGGSGVASLALLAKRAQNDDREVMAVVGARTGDKLMLAWWLRALGCSVIETTDDGSQGMQGTVLDACEAWLEAGWPDAVYACGPEPMLLAVARRSIQLELPCWVAAEREMKCALGVCGHCHCGELLVCQDGPVFAADTYLRACGSEFASGVGAS
ncbi:MAG: dihydroorotate dehydrogenase electron transfer subunit [Anaerolineae bacterium]|nr:dihydroorotate dehydrogenase electron transfer subunit [Anaerolineae bacterium]